jgi:hypothetical protein
MNQHASGKTKSRKFTPLGVIFAVLGLLLFAYFVRKAGVAEILANIKKLGAGFLLILLISVVRKVVRAIAWTRCVEAPHKLRFRHALKAIVMGDALGTVMPLGILVSEPTKAALVRERVPLMVAVSSIAVENLFYSLSVVLFIFSGMMALAWSFTLEKYKLLRWTSMGSVVATLVIVPLAYLVIRQRWKFLSGALELIYARGIDRGFLEKQRERVRAFEDRVYGFYERNSSRFLSILLLEICFHLSGVAEVYVTLTFLSGWLAPTWLAALIFETVNRVINVAFKPIPFRLGIDEAATGQLAQLLGFAQATGVTLALLRKSRDICWTALGVALLVRRGLSLHDAATEAEAAATEASAARPSASVPASESR